MKLASVVAVAAIEAAAKQLGINVTAKQLPILIAIQVGHFLTEIDIEGSVYVKDGVGAVDGALLHFFKTLTENPVLSDNAVTAFYKVLAENPSVSDTQVFDFYKNANCRLNGGIFRGEPQTILHFYQTNYKLLPLNLYAHLNVEFL
jgi:hypothetical protein